jgi:hypothetical protein
MPGNTESPEKHYILSGKNRKKEHREAKNNRQYGLFY